MVLKLDKATCVQLLGSAAEVFEREARRRARENDLVETVLGGLDFYRALTTMERMQLAGALEEEVFEYGDAVVREGDVADAMYIIKSGEVQVSRRVGPPRVDAAERWQRKGGLLRSLLRMGSVEVGGAEKPGEDAAAAAAAEKIPTGSAEGAAAVADAPEEIVLAVLGSGTYFGESALLGGAQQTDEWSPQRGPKRGATITATSRKLVVLRLDRERCVNLLGSVQAILEREAKRRAEANAAVEEEEGTKAAAAAVGEEAEEATKAAHIEGATVAAPEPASEAAGRVALLLKTRDDATSNGGSSKGGSSSGGSSSDSGVVVGGGVPWSCNDALRALVHSFWFGMLANALVVANMVLMCLPYYGMPAEEADLLERTTNIITATYLVEVLGCLSSRRCSSNLCN